MRYRSAIRSHSTCGRSSRRTPSRRARSARRSRSGPAPATTRTSRGISGRRDGPHQRVETFLRCEPRHGENDDVVGAEPDLGAKRVAPRLERVDPIAERGDVDRVREDVDPRRVGAAREHRFSRERADHQHMRRRRAPSRGRGLASRHDARLVVRLGRSTRRATRTAPAGDGTTRSRPAKRTCSSPTPRRPPGRSCPARRRRRRRWGSRAGGRDRRPESGAPPAPRRDGRAREPTLGAGPTLPHTPPSGRPRAGRPDVRASGCDRASAREAPS